MRVANEAAHQDAAAALRPADDRVGDGLRLRAAHVTRHAAVAAYKSFSQVERAFRSLRTVDLHVRPVVHYASGRVRAHVLLCMLAYYVEWHLRERRKPMHFDDWYLAKAQASALLP
jgi:transposase